MADNISDNQKYEFKATEEETAKVDIKFKILDSMLGLASCRREELEATSQEFCFTVPPSLAKDALMFQIFYANMASSLTQNEVSRIYCSLSVFTKPRKPDPP